MKKVTQKIVSITIATIVLLSTSGFNLFIHHCQCEGEIHLSIFNEVGYNHIHSKTHAHCCIVHFDETLKFDEKQSCGCWNEVLKVKTDSYSNIQKVETGNLFSKYIAVNHHKGLNTTIHKLIPTYKTNWDKAPPCSTGKKICIENHQLKIAHTI